jgi:hypothetical protein
MVMDCLRNAKRFHATVSFIADTGLTDATDNGTRLSLRLFTSSDQCTVHKYNQLMKDFPLNELLSAPDVDKIQEALTLIFGARQPQDAPIPISDPPRPAAHGSDLSRL